MKDIKCKIKSDIKQLYDDIRSRLNLKKILLPNLPYLFVFWLIDKLAQAYRITNGGMCLRS